MYTLTLYFDGTRTRWAGKVCQDEVIAQEDFPWLWLARWRANSLMKPLHPGRVAWVISLDGESIEEQAPHTGPLPRTGY